LFGGDPLVDQQRDEGPVVEEQGSDVERLVKCSRDLLLRTLRGA
jgi:hypothetical protein